ncbi:SCO family protein [Sphingobacterium sp. SRCM116780]|uniref:SCO family protein n=1 Tax=Sphingobacterium sp. SRCM116780 TaxID=2907623 RepID=UPI001F1BD78F|nr:SCO family protein [Sphingobacterium sp. SRCM116780]UIR55240.1 SCO family protein [Sphingobacterium sp. SRCM116780]
MSQNTGRNKGIQTIMILAIVLLLPGFLYVVLNKSGMANSYSTLPIYGEKKVPGTTHRKWGRDLMDTIYHEVPNLSFVNYDGKKIQLFEQDSAITVIHLFYSRDQSFSTTLINNLNKITGEFRQSPNIKFYSITVDTSYDSPEVVTKYIKNIDPSGKSWYFLTKPSSDIFKFAKDGLLQDALTTSDVNKPFVIGSSYVLIDSKRRIRGFYDVTMKKEPERLADEIKLLTVEEIRNHPAKIETK